MTVGKEKSEYMRNIRSLIRHEFGLIKCRGHEEAWVVRKRIENLVSNKLNFICVGYLSGDLNQEHKRSVCSGNRYLGIIHT